MSCRYGLSYMGSKNSIAQEIINLLPPRENLYDLFCGGCAITHCAIVNNKFKHYYINDIQPKQAQFFLDCVNGKYRNETRWISRDMFMENYKTDPYISCIWSFGNKGYTYIYGRDIEPFKKALHYAIVFNDYSLLKELGYDIPNFSDIKDLSKRRKTICKYFKDKYKDIAIMKHLEMQSLERLERLQSLERLERLESLDKINCISDKITASCLDYSQVEIKPNSVIYCDIPYENTSNYLSTKDKSRSSRTKSTFDYDKFYEWACNQKELVVISSYEIKDNKFTCVWEREKVVLFNQCKGNRKAAVERLYVPSNQLEIWKAYNPLVNKKQMSIFDIE